MMPECRTDVREKEDDLEEGKLAEVAEPQEVWSKGEGSYEGRDRGQPESSLNSSSCQDLHWSWGRR